MKDRASCAVKGAWQSLCGTGVSPVHGGKGFPRGGERARCPFHKAAVRVLAVAVALGCGSAWADIPASAYVQHGLIAQWDGIDNAGTGTHQADATAWKDISTAAKGGDLTLAATESFGDNCLKVTTAGTHVTGNLGLSSMTLEFALKRTSGSTGIRRWDNPSYTSSFESWSTDNEGLLERIGSTRQLTVKPVNGTMYALATRYTNGGEGRRPDAGGDGVVRRQLSQDHDGRHACDGEPRAFVDDA